MTGVEERLWKVFSSVQDAEFMCKARGYLFTFGPPSALTAFCVPNLEERQFGVRLNFEIGLTTLSPCTRSREGFRENILADRYVALPYTIPVSQSEQMIVSNGKLSRWAAEQMIDYTRNYSIGSEEALALIARSSDPIIEKFRRVFRAKFNDVIVEPLVRER